MTSGLNRRGALLFALLSAIAAALGAFALSSGGKQQAHAGDANPIAAASGDFAVLSRSASPADAEGIAYFRHNDAVDASTARAVRLDGRQAWVAAGNNLICFAIRGSVSANTIGGACSSVDDARAEGLFFTSHPAPQDASAAGVSHRYLEVAGLVPNGVTEVTLHRADGHNQSIRASGNMVAALSPDTVDEVSFVDGAGRQHTQKLHP